MAIVPETRSETSIDLEHSAVGIPAGLLAWIALAAYAAFTLALLVVGAVAALYVAAAVPGVAGAVVFLTLGLVTFSAAPALARRLLIRFAGVVEARWRRPE